MLPWRLNRPLVAVCKTGHKLASSMFVDCTWDKLKSKCSSKMVSVISGSSYITDVSD